LRETIRAVPETTATLGAVSILVIADHRMIARLALAAGCLLFAVAVQADLPSPRLDQLTPVGAAAGSVVEVVLTGNDLDGGETLLCGHPGLRGEFIKAENPSRLHFRLHTAPDVPKGTYDVAVVGRFGVSNPRLWHVAHGLEDVSEVEPNNTRDQAQSVPINAAISGQADGNNQDVFRFAGKQGQRILIDCLSARLETEMDALLVVTGPTGQQIASNSDYFGRDPLVDFVVTADGDYFVEVRDLTYRGGYPYRLLIHDRPQVEHVFPRAVTVGQSATLTAYGRNLGGSPGAWRIGELPLEEKSFSYMPPVDLLAMGGFRFREHPLQHSVLPTAATCTLVGEQFLALDADPVTVVLSEGPTGVEQEPNDTREQSQPLTVPAMISARFDRPRDADWYVFETDETGGAYGFDVYAERIAGRCDPYLFLYDEQGNRIFELDDYGHRVNAFDGHLRDPSGQTNLPGKKQFRVLVQDRYQRGGARYQYVLNVRKAKSDFFAASIHSSPTLASTTVWQGGAASLDVVLHHVDGGNQFPVTITAEQLPPGLHVAPTVIGADNRGSVVFWAEEQAPPWTGAIRLWATSKHGDRELRREVRPYTRAYQQVGSRPMREQWLALRERAPFGLRIEPERLTIEAGQKADVRLILARYWPDFTGAVNYQPLNWPGQFQLGNGTIAAGQTEASLSVTVQPGTRPGDYTLSVLGQAQVPFHKDPNEKNRPNTLVAMPARPVTITVIPAEKR
jgi:hypothetical protein